MTANCPYLLGHEPIIRTEQLIPGGIEVTEVELDAPKYVEYEGLLMDAEDADYIFDMYDQFKLMRDIQEELKKEGKWVVPCI